MNIFNLRNQLLNDSASVMKSRWTYTSPSKADGITQKGNQLPGRTDASTGLLGIYVYLPVALTGEDDIETK